MKNSTALATKPIAGRQRHRPCVQSVPGVQPTCVAVKAISARASEIEQLLDAPLSDDESTYPIVLASLPPPTHFGGAIAELETVLSRSATTPECQALIVLMFDTLGCRVDAGAKNRVSGYVLALMNDGLDDETVISSTVLGLAIARQLKTAKRPPLPSRLLAECVSVREKVETLRHRLQTAESRSLDLRDQLQWRIDTRNDTTAENRDNGIAF